MKDIEVFEKFMSWIGIKLNNKEMLEDGSTILTYSGYGNHDGIFTSIGYDEFYTGIHFDKNGTLIKGYLDSHVSHSSKNCKLIDKLICKTNQ